jgi:hypothetical protein
VFKLSNLKRVSCYEKFVLNIVSMRLLTIDVLILIAPTDSKKRMILFRLEASNGEVWVKG